jgi:hypothetical protein
LTGEGSLTNLFLQGEGEEAMNAVSKKRAYGKDGIKWSTEIDLSRRKQKSQSEAKVAYLKQGKELKSKQESVKRRVREFRASGDEAWEDFKGEVEEATKDLKADG